MDVIDWMGPLVNFCHRLNVGIGWMGSLVNESFVNGGFGWMSHCWMGVIDWMVNWLNAVIGEWDHWWMSHWWMEHYTFRCFALFQVNLFVLIFFHLRRYICGYVIISVASVCLSLFSQVITCESLDQQTSIWAHILFHNIQIKSEYLGYCNGQI